MYHTKCYNITSGMLHSRPEHIQMAYFQMSGWISLLSMNKARKLQAQKEFNILMHFTQTQCKCKHICPKPCRHHPLPFSPYAVSVITQLHVPTLTRIGSRIKKIGVLFPTKSQLPSSVQNLRAKPRGSLTVSALPLSPPGVCLDQQ